MSGRGSGDFCDVRKHLDELDHSIARNSKVAIQAMAEAYSLYRCDSTCSQTVSQSDPSKTFDQTDYCKLVTCAVTTAAQAGQKITAGVCDISN
jgi:hypothetical protein